jgi:hypothetical protein
MVQSVRLSFSLLYINDSLVIVEIASSRLRQFAGSRRSSLFASNLKGGIAFGKLSSAEKKIHKDFLSAAELV